MADTTLRLLGAGTAISDGDLFLTRQGADTSDTSVTGTQVKDYVGTVYVPYTGATADVDITGFNFTANRGFFLAPINGDTLTASEIIATDSSKNLVSLPVATYPSLTELSYVKGVTSAIQTQLNTKLSTISGIAAGGDLTGTYASPSVVSASDTVAGKVELATITETNTGTDAARAVTPDGLAGSYAGQKTFSVTVIPTTTAVTTGDGKGTVNFRIPTILNGMNLVMCAAAVNTTSSSGNPTIQLARGRQSSPTSAHTYADMLSTRITIDATEYDSKDAATSFVIDTANDDVLTGDLIRFDVDVAGTGTKGLTITMTFQLP